MGVVLLLAALAAYGIAMKPHAVTIGGPLAAPWEDALDCPPERAVLHVQPSASAAPPDDMRFDVVRANPTPWPKLLPDASLTTILYQVRPDGQLWDLSAGIQPRAAGPFQRAWSIPPFGTLRIGTVAFDRDPSWPLLLCAAMPDGACGVVWAWGGAR